MSVIKRIVKDSIERLEVDELLAEEYEQAGYGGIILTKTPLGAQINLFTMRPGRVIGKRGRAIKSASERLESELGLSNPQITVLEVEVPELNPRIMASRIANALERGVHYRRSIFWALRRIMEAGAVGCEIVVRGKLRSRRRRFEKVSEGYLPKSGDPAIKHLKSAVIHVKLKRGTLGVNVSIVPPEAKFPDKISLEDLPEVEVPEEKPELPEVVEPEVQEAAAVAVETEAASAYAMEPSALDAAEVHESSEGLAEAPEAAAEITAEEPPKEILGQPPDEEAGAAPAEVESTPEKSEEVGPTDEQVEESGGKVGEIEAASQPEDEKTEEG